MPTATSGTLPRGFLPQGGVGALREGSITDADRREDGGQHVLRNRLSSLPVADHAMSTTPPEKR